MTAQSNASCGTCEWLKFWGFFSSVNFSQQIITTGRAVFQFTLQKQSSPHADGQRGTRGEQCGNALGFADTILFVWHLQGWTSVGNCTAKLSCNCKKPRFCPLVKLDQKWTNVLKKRQLRFVSKLGKNHSQKRQELWGWAQLADAVLGVCRRCLMTVARSGWSCQGPPCTPTRLSTPNCHYWLWADYLNRLIWGPKSTSGNDERWSRSIRDIKQQNIFPSTDGNT